jgi:hypothetical protein
MARGEHEFDQYARELAETGTAKLHLGPNTDVIFTVRDSEHEPGEKRLHTTLTTGGNHEATLSLTTAPILPPGVPWGGAVFTAVVDLVNAIPEVIERFLLSRTTLETAIPSEMKR